MLGSFGEIDDGDDNHDDDGDNDDDDYKTITTNY